MNVSYIYINIAAFLCFALMFVAFCAAERSREMRAWLVLLGDLVLWTGGTVFICFAARAVFDRLSGV